jgi:hypothetical protein
MLLRATYSLQQVSLQKHTLLQQLQQPLAQELQQQEYQRQHQEKQQPQQLALSVPQPQAAPHQLQQQQLLVQPRWVLLRLLHRQAQQQQQVLHLCRQCLGWMHQQQQKLGRVQQGLVQQQRVRVQQV